MILVTGGAGVIGANFVLDWLAKHDEPVINLDKLTYASNMEALASLQDDPRHTFVKGDIVDSALPDQGYQRRTRAWHGSKELSAAYAAITSSKTKGALAV